MARWRDWAGLGLAASLFVAPWLLGFATAAPVTAWNAWAVAILLGVVAVAALVEPAGWLAVVRLVAALWLAASPALLPDQPPVAAAATVATGVATALLAASTLLWPRRRLPP